MVKRGKAAHIAAVLGLRNEKRIDMAAAKKELEGSDCVSHGRARSGEMEKNLDAKAVNPGMKGAQRGDDIGIAKVEQVMLRGGHGGQGAEGEFVALDLSAFCIPILKFLQGQGLILRFNFRAVQEYFNIHR